MSKPDHEAGDELRRLQEKKWRLARDWPSLAIFSVMLATFIYALMRR